PVPRLAIHLDSSSETSEPPKPNSAAMISRPPIWLELTPSSDITMLARNSTAQLVARNRARRLNTYGNSKGWPRPDVPDMGTGGLEIKTTTPRPCGDGAASVHTRPSLPRTLRALAHRPAACRLAGGGAGQLAAGTRRWRPVAGAD